MATSMKTKKKSKKHVIALETEVNEAPDHNPETEMNLYQNTQLQKSIESQSNYGTVVVMFYPLVEQDMELIIQEAIIKKQCKELKINQTKLSSSCALILANALNDTDNILQNLSLYDNLIGDEGASYFARALSNNNNNLKALCLSKNKITNVGAKHLAEMLKINENLTSLSVGSNQIGNEGIQILANTIQYYNKTITDLNLSANDSVDDSIIDCLIQLIKYSQSLKSLHICNCNLSQKGMDKLRKMQTRKEGFFLSVW